jgi:hypothetical protein
MRKVCFALVMLGMLGCGAAEEAPKEEKKRPSVRPIPTTQIKPATATKVEKKKSGEPEPPPPYTFGDLVFALEEDAKARSGAGGRLDGVDPRRFKPDIRHERIRAVLAEHYKSEITLQSILKLRDDLCKENKLTPEQVNAVKLDEIAEVFEKAPQ